MSKSIGTDERLDRIEEEERAAAAYSVASLMSAAATDFYKRYPSRQEKRKGQDDE